MGIEHNRLFRVRDLPNRFAEGLFLDGFVFQVEVLDIYRKESLEVVAAEDFIRQPFGLQSKVQVMRMGAQIGGEVRRVFCQLSQLSGNSSHKLLYLIVRQS